MIAEIAASGAALTWGTADFCGGKASRWVNARAVVVVSQLSSFPLLALSLVLAGSGRPEPADLGWGFLAGLSGGIALVLLYEALATGVMSVVAPVTAITAALLPLGVGLVFDRAPGTVELIGAVVAVLAIGLVSAAPGGKPMSTRVIVLSVAAGTGFGLFYALLAPVRPDAGLWPLVGVRTAGLVVGLVLLWQARQPLAMSRKSLAWSVGAGALDWAANALYLVATYGGTLSVVAPIASLYPAGTVLLALAVDRERLRPAQLAGLGLAGVALVLTRLG